MISQTTLECATGARKLPDSWYRRAGRQARLLQDGRPIAVLAPAGFRAIDFAQAIVNELRGAVHDLRSAVVDLNKYHAHHGPLTLIFDEVLSAFDDEGTHVTSETVFFRRLRTALVRRPRTVVIFRKIDSLDTNAASMLASAIRKLTQDEDTAGRFLCIVTGHNALYDLTIDNPLDVSPLGNAERVVLEPLEYEEFCELFTFASRETLSNDSRRLLLNTAYEETGGHPAICEILAEQLDDDFLQSDPAPRTDRQIRNWVEQVAKSPAVQDSPFVNRVMRHLERDADATDYLLEITRQGSVQVSDTRVVKRLQFSGAICGEDKLQFCGNIFARAAETAFREKNLPSIYIRQHRWERLQEILRSTPKKRDVSSYRMFGALLERAFHSPERAKPDELLRLILNELKGVFKYDYVNIFLVEPGRPFLRCVHSSAKSMEELNNVVVGFAPPDSLVGLAAARRQPTFTEDVIPDNRHSEALRSMLGYPKDAVLNVPLTVEGELIGVIGVGSDEVSRLRADIEAIWEFANQLAHVVYMAGTEAVMVQLFDRSRALGHCASDVELGETLCQILEESLSPEFIAFYQRSSSGWVRLVHRQCTSAKYDSFALEHLSCATQEASTLSHSLWVTMHREDVHTTAATIGSSDGRGVTYGVVVGMGSQHHRSDRSLKFACELVRLTCQLAVGPLESLRAQADRINMLRIQWGELCHSLTNPHWSIKLAIDNLKRELQNGASQTVMAQQIARIEEALFEANAAKEDLRDTLSYGKHEGETYDLTEAIREGCEMALSSAPSSGRKVLTSRIPKTLPQVRGHRGCVKRCIRNLVLNALEATSDDEEVSVYVDADGDTVKVIIKDGGRGLPKGIDIFSFGGTTKSGRGRGFGLPFCKWMVEREYGGQLTLQSHEDRRGTVACMALPKLEGDQND